MNSIPMDWKEHPIRVGDGKGGWAYQEGEYLFRHRSTGKYVFPFGVARMDNDEIILICSWHNGDHEVPVVSFSKDEGDTWSEFSEIPGITGRPMMLAALGGGTVTFQGDGAVGGPGRFFSHDYGRTWDDVVAAQPAENGGPWYVEGNPLVDFDPAGNLKAIAETGTNWGPPGKAGNYPVDPTITAIRWSYDGGRTWRDQVTPKTWQWTVTHDGKDHVRGADEGSLVRATNGWIVAALRANMPPRFFETGNDNLDGMGISISKDNGKSWSPIQFLYECGRHHPNLLRLPNGDIVMTYIVRVDYQDGQLASYRRGCEAMISHDNGQTWTPSRRYILDEYEFFDGKEWFNGESGHLYSVALKDGRVLTAYGNYRTNGAALIRWTP